MIMYEQDPDVVRWGLHLLSYEPIPTKACCGSVIQTNSSICNGNSGGHHYVENDAAIAHAFQEELSNVAIAEASGPVQRCEEHFQASVLAQDWIDPSVNISNPEGSCRHEDNMELSGPCSSPEERPYGGSDCFLELSDESYVLDGEVGKRLTKMVPVPHVPRINKEIPSIDEATSDYQLLLDRLQLYFLDELKVEGDGNCQFRSLSDQFYRTPEHHKFVRQQIVNQLKQFPEIYEGYVPLAYEEYIKKMSRNGEWGDHVTLQAAADTYGVKIFILTSFKDTCYIEILPNVQKSSRVIFLSFWAEVHYNSIYPEGDMPMVEEKKKKRWWRWT